MNSQSTAKIFKTSRLIVLDITGKFITRQNSD